MTASAVSPKSYARKYAGRSNGLHVLLSTLGDRPSPKEIHDIRVAARRAQVLRSLLPKVERRTKEARAFNLALKSIRKATSQVRDIDTLSGTLDRLSALLPAQLLVSLQNERSDASARAWVDLSSVAKVAPPGLAPEGLGKRRLRRRFNKMVRARRKTLEYLWKRVVSDEGRVEELHSLRKNAKMLRYLLEVAQGTTSEVRKLRKLQDSLGVIHDLDVAMEYLQKNGWDFPKEPALRELRRERRSRYHSFVGDNDVGTTTASQRRALRSARASFKY